MGIERALKAKFEEQLVEVQEVCGLDLIFDFRRCKVMYAALCVILSAGSQTNVLYVVIQITIKPEHLIELFYVIKPDWT